MDRAEWEKASTAEKMTLLRERLSSVPKLAEMSDPEHDEASAIAFGLVEIGDGIREILTWTERLPTFDQMSDSEILDNLWDLGDMLRHLLSHARHPRFFAVYLDDPR